MNISQLIDAAREKVGSSATLAEGLGMHPNRLTDWKAGRRKPEASEIAYLAEQAELPVLETVAEIEGQLNGRYAHIWKTALANLRAASVGGALALLVWTGFGIAPNQSYAADHGDAAFTRQGSLVRSQYRPPKNSPLVATR
ncbi:helix-turn-helix domain-containing protein [Burkholderia pseudomallei]|nr:helix-turn-helix transcriptional regulator [Burkholderia pseudomallei]